MQYPKQVRPSLYSNNAGMLYFYKAPPGARAEFFKYALGEEIKTIEYRRLKHEKEQRTRRDRHYIEAFRI